MVHTSHVRVRMENGHTGMDHHQTDCIGTHLTLRPLTKREMIKDVREAMREAVFDIFRD